jgi:hypothetical protein
MRTFLKKKIPHYFVHSIKLVLFIINSPIQIALKKIQLICFQNQVKNNHRKALLSIKKKDKIIVVFLLIHEAVWKCDDIYKLMLQHPRFEPFIVACPYTIYGEEIMNQYLNSSFNNFREAGYNVVNSFKNDGSWLDVKRELMPDIVFFTNPWDLTLKQYQIDEFHDTLTCYVPYFYHVTKHLKENYGRSTQNMCWKVFYESKIHYDFAKKYSTNNAANVVITGYPGLDTFLFDKQSWKDPWKISSIDYKRIIWAPHHTISGQDSDLGLSNFITYADFFIRTLNSYSRSIQIAFKPHPLLKPKLYNDKHWGVDKTNKYFKYWEESTNGMLVEGNYTDLFLSSDAIIHDSGSFTVEFIATQKPALYLLSSVIQLESLNHFGKKAVEMHYIAKNEIEINSFIEEVVIQQNDPMKFKRIAFINEYLMPPGNTTAAMNIFNYILSNI